MSSWMYECTFKQKGQKSMTGSGNCIYHWPDVAHLFFCSLTYTDLVVADTASDEGEATEKTCEIADIPTSFKSDLWKHFGFAVLLLSHLQK